MPANVQVVVVVAPDRARVDADRSTGPDQLALHVIDFDHEISDVPAAIRGDAEHESEARAAMSKYDDRARRNKPCRTK
jgi:hypothetical protein